MLRTIIKAGVMLSLAASAALLTAQVDTAKRSIAGGAAVEYAYPEQVTVPAGKSTTVALHFRIAQSLHINSHLPHEEFLIPTDFSIPAADGVKLDTVNYPQGVDITLPADPKTKVSVYTGEFVLQARIVATAGNHLVEAKLHYQACNDTQCLPPKTIPVAIDVIGQ